MRHLLFPMLLLYLATGILAGGCGEELPSPTATTEGYPRVVLAELLTTTWCGWCPTAEEAMDRLFEEEGPEKLAVIHWHPSYGQGDPYAIHQADVRTEVYEVFVGDPPGFPVCVYDGVAYFRGGWVGLYDDYRTRYEAEAAMGSSLEILLDPEISGNSAKVEVEFLSLATLVGATYDLVLVAVEHHAVEGNHTSSYVARTSVTQDVTLHADHTHSQTVELALEPDWKREDLWVVAFVQQQTADESAARKVIQAAMVPLIPEEDDFYAFVLSAPDTTVSLAVGGEREFPLSIQNTGTLDDTVTVDLPPALTSVPPGWIIGLRTSDGAELVTPSTSPIAAGERIDALRLRVVADEAGSGSIGITCASWGDPALVDTLTFHVSSGSFGVTLQAGDTDLDVLSGTAFLAPFTVTNSGTVEDSITIDLPDSLWNVPAGWKITLADFGGTEIAAPLAIELAPEAENTDLRLRVLATGEGNASAGLTAVSHGDPQQTQTLEFTITSRAYNFDLSTESTDLQAVVGTPLVAPFDITNTGSRDDLLIIDLFDDPNLPEDWQTNLVYAEEVEIPTPHPLLLEQGETASRFGVRISADSRGVATVDLVVSSSGDPTSVDTLSFQVSANEYGLDLEAPEGTTISLSPGTVTLIPFELTNSGTLDDAFILDLPAAGLDVPPGWEISVTDAEQNEVALPLEASLSAGSTLDTLFIRALAPAAGSGSVELTATSLGLPTLSETLTFTLSASQYGFAIEAETDVEAEEVPGFTMAPFTLVNTGAVDDTLTISAPTALQQPPAGWGPAIICDDEQCYPPDWELETPIAAGESFSGYYVDWYIPGPGIGTVDLVVVSRGDPALADTLTFTFTSAKGLTFTGASSLRSPVIRSSKPMMLLPVAGTTR